MLVLNFNFPQRPNNPSFVNCQAFGMGRSWRSSRRLFAVRTKFNKRTRAPGFGFDHGKSILDTIYIYIYESLIKVTIKFKIDRTGYVLVHAHLLAAWHREIGQYDHDATYVYTYIHAHGCLRKIAWENCQDTFWLRKVENTTTQPFHDLIPSHAAIWVHKTWSF